MVPAPLSHSLGLLGDGDTHSVQPRTAPRTVSPCQHLLREDVGLGRGSCIFQALGSHKWKFFIPGKGISTHSARPFPSPKSLETHLALDA